MQKRKLTALFLAVFMMFTCISFSADAATANDNVYRGHYSMRVYTDGNSNDQQVKYVNVQPDTDYVVTYWAKGDGHKRFVVHESDPAIYNWGDTIVHNEFNGPDWTQYTMDFNSGTTTLLAIEISANQWGGAGAGYIDDIVIAEKNNSSVTVLTDDFEAGKAWADNAFFSVEYSAVAQRTDGEDPGEDPGDGPDVDPDDPDDDEDQGDDTPTNPDSSANDNVYRGHYSMKIYTDGSSHNQQAKYFTVQPDTDYVVTFWAKGDGYKNFVVHASDPAIYNWGATLVQGQINGADWKEYTLNFNSGSNTLIVIEISSNPWGGAGAGYIDDIVIAKKNDPSAIVTSEGFESGVLWGDANESFSAEYSAVPQRTLPSTFSVVENTFKRGSRIATVFSPDDVITGTVKLYNGTDAEESAIYVVAVYNGRTLSGVFVDMPEDGKVGVGEYETLTVTVDLSDYPEADTIKAFVWDGPESLVPLTEEKSLEQGEEKEFVLGTLQSKQQNFQANLDAGMNTVLFELSWGSFYSADGVKNTSYINEKKALLSDMYDKGFDVMLGLGTQYPPSWIYSYPNSRYKNQYGDEYNTTEIGDTAVNAVFNNAMREKLEEYVDDVFEEFGTEFSIVRLGWMRYGEIGFPNQSYNGKTNSWWAFDDIAQGKVTGLPEGIPACPVPGWIPGTASTNNSDARAFAEWYMDALLNYQNWQVDMVSEKVDSRLAILYPSWGMREGQLENAIKGNLSGTTGPEKNGEVQRGFDFARLITGITNPKAIVYCTWIDANPEWTNGDDQEVPTTSNNFSPVHYMAYYAKNHPLNLSIMGENTGGGGMNALNLTFERMKKYELYGIMWAFEPDLYDGSAPVLSDFAAAIKDFVETMTE